MSTTASQLTANVSVTGASQAAAELTGVGAASDSAGSRLGGLVGGGLLVAGAALVGVGVKAVQMAGDFQSSMTQLVTGAGESAANIGTVSSAVLAMAGQTGTSTKDLASGMYLIESAGYHGSAGLTVLKDAAEGAKVGNASLAVVANGVTTIMTDYAAKHVTAAQATNTLIAAVANGKTTMNALSTAMATVLPTAASVGVGLNDVAGAMSTMTGEGVPAAAAATYLRQMLMALDNPSAKGAAALKSVGLSSTEVATEMKKSLPDTLQMITDAVGKKFPAGSSAYVAALAAISGGSKQMQGMLLLTGAHMAVFKGNVDAVSKAVSQGGDSIVGWSMVQGDFNFKMDAAKASVEAFMITIGTALLPVITLIVGAVTPVLSSFTAWITQNNILGGAVDAIVSAIGNFTSALGPMSGLLTPLAPLFTQIGQVGSQAFQDLGRTFQQVGDVISNVFDALTKGAGTQVKGAFTSMVSGVKPIIDGFGTFIHGVMTNIQIYLDTVNTQSIVNTIRSMSGAIVPILAGIGAVILTVLVPAIWSLVAAAAAAAAEMLIAAAPFVAIGAAVALLTALFIHLYQTNAPFRDFINGIVTGIKQAWSVISSNFMPVLQQLWSIFTSDILPILQKVGSFVGGEFTAIWHTLVDLWQTQLQPALVQIWGAIQPLLPIFEALAAVVGGVVVVAIIALIALLEGLAKGFANLVTGIALIFTGLVQIITGIFGIIAGIVRVFIDLITLNFSDLGPALGAIWQGIVTLVSGALNTIRGIFVAIFGTIIGFVVGFAHGIIDIFTSLWDSLVGHSIIPDMLNAILQWFIQVPTQILASIGAWVTNLLNIFIQLNVQALALILSMWNAILQWFNTGITNVVSAVTSWVNTVVTWITNLSSQASTLISSLWNTLETGFSDGVNAVISTVTNWVNSIINWITNLSSQASSLISSLWNDLTSNFNAGINAVIGAVSSWVSNVLNWINTLRNSAISAVSSLWGSCQGAFNAGINAVVGVVATLPGRVLGILNGLIGAAAQAGANIVQAIANGILGAIGAVVNAVSSVAAAIMSHLPHSPAKEGPLRGLPTAGQKITQQIGEGMQAAMPSLKTSMNVLLAPIVNAGVQVPVGTSSVPVQFPSMHQAAAPAPQVTVQPAHVYLDGRVLMNGLMPYLADNLKYGTGLVLS